MPKVSELRNKLFGTTDYVCGGHGARRPSHGKFQVPSGVTIKFYILDTKGLPNLKGQAVDQVLAGGAPPQATETFTPGMTCHDYHLYSSKAGGYLNLAMSSNANPRYISTNDADRGLALSAIVTSVVKLSPSVVIHWSACRSLEADSDKFGPSRPRYGPELLKLGKRPTP